MTQTATLSPPVVLGASTDAALGAVSIDGDTIVAGAVCDGRGQHRAGRDLRVHQDRRSLDEPRSEHRAYRTGRRDG